MKTAAQIDAMVAEEFGLTKTKAKDILHYFTSLMIGEATEAGRFAYNGVIIKKKHRAGRTGRNPRTGEAISIPAQDVLTLRKKVC